MAFPRFVDLYKAEEIRAECSLTAYHVIWSLHCRNSTTFSQFCYIQEENAELYRAEILYVLTRS
jgi:hypothetical protein